MSVRIRWMEQFKTPISVDQDQQILRRPSEDWLERLRLSSCSLFRACVMDLSVKFPTTLQRQASLSICTGLGESTCYRSPWVDLILTALECRISSIQASWWSVLPNAGVNCQGIEKSFPCHTSWGKSVHIECVSQQIAFMYRLQGYFCRNPVCTVKEETSAYCSPIYPPIEKQDEQVQQSRDMFCLCIVYCTYPKISWEP